ncbi:MAG: ribokinase [Pirellulales bacterium]
MSLPVYNLGSLNLDRVMRVGHIARPGETLAARSIALFAGGKGANQSVALARAGARVVHVGCVGDDGRWLVEKLAAEGVDTRFVRVAPALTGQAIIQVDDAGENAIVVYGGSNQQVTPADVEHALADAPAESWLLAQNETSAVEHAIRLAHARGMRICLNPAPLDERAREYPLELVHLLCVNETEGAALTGESSAKRIIDGLRQRVVRGEVLLTLGASGAWYAGPRGELRADAPRVAMVVDATAAGDTFLGYYLAAKCRGLEPVECLARACRAVRHAGRCNGFDTARPSDCRRLAAISRHRAQRTNLPDSLSLTDVVGYHGCRASSQANHREPGNRGNIHVGQ